MQRITALRLACASLLAGASLELSALRPVRAEVPAAFVQRLEPGPRDQGASLESEHFVLVWDPERVTREQAEQARDHSEKAWQHCRELFGTAPAGKIRLDLTPRFWGATGFAQPARRRGGQQTERIGVRYADLEYLGPTAEYVLTHEVGHIFSGDLAGSTLGEGIADWAAGGFSGIPMRPWWGRALREAGLWIDPEALFVTGEFEANPEVNAVIRTVQYSQSALLVRFLIDRYGWEKFRAFARDYARARGRLESNTDRAQNGRGPANRPPDPEAIRAVFPRHFDESWGKLRSEWERGMEAETPPFNEAARLVLSQRIYGAVRNFEMWLLAGSGGSDIRIHPEVQAAFVRANTAARAGNVEEGRRALAQAQRMVDQLRRPRSET